MDEASYLRYERFSQSGKEVTGREGGVKVGLKLLDDKGFDHAGHMDFVDNVIERSSGTIRGRAVFANPTGVLTPGMFGAHPRARLADLRRAAGAGRGDRHRADQKFVLVVDEDNTAVAEIRHARPASPRTTCASSRTGSTAADSVVVNGLMRARPGQKVTPQEPGRGRRRPAGEEIAERSPMRISHFFIDRPIFASVVSIVFVILGAVAFCAPAGRAVSGDRAAGHQHLGPVSRRQCRDGGVHRGRADRGADQRRREHDLHVVEFERRRALLDRRHFEIGTNLDIAQVQVQNRVAIALPRLPADVRNIGVTVAKASPDLMMVVHVLFARQVARCAVHLQLRAARDQGCAHAGRRRRLDHRVRQPRLRDARLARSGAPAVAGHDGVRRDAGAAGPERPGRLRRPQPAAGRPGRRLPDFGADARPPRRSRGVRQHRGQADRERRGAAQGHRPRRARRAGLFVELLSQPRSRGRHRRVPAAGLQCARDRAGDPRDDGGGWRSGSRPASSTTSSTTRPSSSSSRSMR